MINMKIFTIKFNRETESFDDEELRDFCSKNCVLNSENTFFTDGQDKYMTVFVTYEAIRQKPEFKRSYNDKIPESALEESELVLFDRLAEIRVKKAEEKGVPPFLLGTNTELIRVVKSRCTTIASLKRVRGFGKKKVKDIGKEYTEEIKRYCEEEKDST